MQITTLHKHFDTLQQLHGEADLFPIYGTGCIDKPKYCFVFMNPTARNVGAHPERAGLRAPWLGLKQTWKMFYDMGMLSHGLYLKTQSLKPLHWTKDFTHELYNYLVENGIYITNLAKCTQSDAKPLPNKVFKEYLDLFYQEIDILQPQTIITFGNQVSSIVLGKKVSVSNYIGTENEVLVIGNKIYKTYPVYYPVGLGYRNINKAIERIKAIDFVQ